MLAQVGDKFEAGRLHIFTPVWRQITIDSFIWDIVQHCLLDVHLADVGLLFRRVPSYGFGLED